MNFASDNAVGVAPEILAAIAAANAGGALAYGNDAVTRRVEQRFAELFEHEVAVFLVPTGTAAVSPSMTLIRSIGMPKLAATIWAYVVACPWPWLWVPRASVTLPSPATRTWADS